MKKKLIAGFVLMFLIFFASGVVILWNLNTINSNQKLEEAQQRILTKYNDTLFNLRSAQVQLYRHQAGFSRDIDNITVDIIKAEDTLYEISRHYAEYSSRTLCNHCHKGQSAFNDFDDTFKNLKGYIASYEDNISLIVTTNDNREISTVEQETAEDGIKIITLVDDLRHAALKMNERIKELVINSERRSRQSIYLAIIVNFLLAAIVVVITIRSITGPVDMLVTGIKKVSSGDYDAKVDISSIDEIGFLARTFNTMTDNLNIINRHRDLLVNELNELNGDLKLRVQGSIEDLRITNEKLLRNYSLSTVGTFASGVAHELATPLASILSYIQIVKRKISGEDQLKEDINIIEGELRRCREILRGMLDFARAPEQEKMPTNINNILQDLLLLISYQPEYKKIAIKKELTPDMPGIMAVPGQLKQVFMNVIVNALQSMPEGGELGISTAFSGDPQKIIVTVRDTGHGITEEEIKKIFQPFYTSKKTGTGLGLSISYGIIKSHGGEIEVQSDLEKGTAFLIYLPVESEEQIQE
jgi:two-component system NtrC family sensor kinase